jgi:Uma2 family endonuclease
MVNTTTAPKAEIISDRWVKATWDEFLALADDPKLETGRFYYDNHKMRIEMSPVGPIHAHENAIVSKVIGIFAALKNICIYEYINCSFRKKGESECQPDIAFYIGNELRLPPRNNAPVDLNKFDLPTLIVEISSTTLQDDLGYKRLLYERLGILEYWVVNAQTSEVFAFTIADGRSGIVERSQVLEGLEIATVKEALKRSQTEDDGAIARWLLQTFTVLPT